MQCMKLNAYEFNITANSNLNSASIQLKAEVNTEPESGISKRNTLSNKSYLLLYHIYSGMFQTL